MSDFSIWENGRSEREKRSWSAKCGHIKRKIFADEPLKGRTLAFALELLKSESSSDNDMIKNISKHLGKSFICRENIK